MGRVYLKEPDILKLKKKGYAVVDMHIHSSYSCDASSKISDIIKRAKKLGIGIAITDHNKIEGSIIAKRNSKGVLVIPGIELRSKEDVDMLLYFYKMNDLIHFYNKYVIPNKKRDLQGSSKLSISEIMKILKEWECLVCIAHPYRFYIKKLYNMFKKKRRNKQLFKLFKIMEVVNGKNLKRKNKRAIKKARQLQKYFIGGSDAHRIKGIGSAVTCTKKAGSVRKFLDSVKKGKEVIVFGKETKLSYRLMRPFVAVKNTLSSKIRRR